MGIFGRAPSSGPGGTSRQDRRRAGVRGRSRTTTRRDTEKRAQIIIIGAVILVALAVVGIGVYGYYQTNVRPEQQAVLKVGDRTFRMNYVEKRLRYEIQNAAPGDPVLLNTNTALQETFNQLGAEEIDRIGAPQINISVSDDEVDAKIRQNLGLSDSADQATFAEAYRKLVKDSGFSPNEYREFITSQLLEDKIRQNLRSTIPTATEQVHVRDIRVATQDDAQKVLDRLAAGEDFAAIATDVSLDTSTKSNGGDAGWIPRGSVPTNVENAVFALEVGQRTQPISNNNTFFIFEVLEKSPSMEITSAQQTLIENQSYNSWQAQISNQVDVNLYYASDATIIAQLTAIATAAGSGVKATAEPVQP